MVDLIRKINRIEKFVCENFEELEIDDPIGEEYFEEYQEVNGATKTQIQTFEQKFDVTLPSDLKALFQYKNGSKFFDIFFIDIGACEFHFTLLSLEEITAKKEYFQNKNALLSDFPEYFSEQDIANMADERIKPYLFNEKWIPFAQASGSIYLMLDFTPANKGEVGQIICYIHDPDKIVYVANSITEVIDSTLDFLSLSDE